MFNSSNISQCGLLQSISSHRVSCTSTDKATYLNQWSVSDTNQVVVFWKSEGTYTNVDFGNFPPTITEVYNADNMGWSMDYEIGAIDESGIFGKILLCTFLISNKSQIAKETVSELTYSQRYFNRISW